MNAYQPTTGSGIAAGDAPTAPIASREFTAIDGILCLLLSLRSQHDEVRRLNEYERRALSRRRTALRRLDYERIEAERRAAGQAAA